MRKVRLGNYRVGYRVPKEKKKIRKQLKPSLKLYILKTSNLYVSMPTLCLMPTEKESVYLLN